MKKLLTIFTITCMITTYATASSSNTTSLPQTNHYTYKNEYQAASLYQQDNDNVIRNKQDTITLVDFSDYQCLPCRKMNAIVEKLIKKYSNLRIVYIDYPMLGPESIFAAKAALAAMSQGKYFVFHDALMQSKKTLTEDQVYHLAKVSGINVKKLKNEINSKSNLQALLNNMMLGNAFGVVGLPTFVIGYTQSPHNTQVYPGIDPEQLDALIAMTEKERGTRG